MTKMFGLGAVAGLAMGAMLAAAPAQAAVVYSFESTTGIAGSISWDGQATTGIVATGLTISDIELNNGSTTTCTSCTLSFTTGTFAGSMFTTSFFNAGGTFTITGDFGAGVEVLATGNVGTSSFSNSPSGLDGTMSFLNTAIVSPTVQNFFGQDVVLGSLFGGFAAVSFSNSATTGFQSTSIAAVDVHLEVPEPAVLGLLGLGLVGIAAARRRKQAA